MDEISYRVCHLCSVVTEIIGDGPLVEGTQCTDETKTHPGLTRECGIGDEFEVQSRRLRTAGLSELAVHDACPTGVGRTDKGEIGAGEGTARGACGEIDIRRCCARRYVDLPVGDVDFAGLHFQRIGCCSGCPSSVPHLNGKAIVTLGFGLQRTCQFAG
ncbi:hypothetical protein D3C80_1466460 [compost metagenome]